MESRLRKSGGMKRHWVTEAINFMNEHIPAFKDVFDKVMLYFASLSIPNLFYLKIGPNFAFMLQNNA